LSTDEHGFTRIKAKSKAKQYKAKARHHRDIETKKKVRCATSRRRLAAGVRIVGSELERAAEAGLQVLAHVHDFHAGHDHEFAGEHVARLIIVGQLTTDAAILAVLIPAEAAVRDRFRADELKCAKE